MEDKARSETDTCLFGAATRSDSSMTTTELAGTCRALLASEQGGYAPQKLLLRSLALASLDHTCRVGISGLIAEPEGPAFISSTVT
jgi:hypothetical protein